VFDPYNRFSIAYPPPIIFYVLPMVEKNGLSSLFRTFEYLPETLGFDM
jgi:hypothetical protein